MTRQTITYSEIGLVNGLQYYGVVYCRNGHTFYTRPFKNRSSARREALRLNKIHG
jgi:hypothetical protein